MRHSVKAGLHLALIVAYLAAAAGLISYAKSSKAMKVINHVESN